MIRTRVAGVAACLLAWLAAGSLWQVTHASENPDVVTWPRPALDAAKGARQRLLDIDGTETLVAVGEQGLILRSTNGVDWTQVSSPVDTMLTRVKFVDDARGFILGHDAVILETHEGGKHWLIRHHDSDARALLDVIQLDQTHWLAVGAYGAMLESTDDGQTWMESPNALADLGMHLNRIVRIDPSTLFVAGERGLAARSVDNGASWEVLDFPYAGSLFGAQVVDNRLWVHGMRGRLYATDALDRCATTPAETWDPYERITIEDPEKVAALGWKHIPTPTEESLFGAEPTAKGLLLFGVNGTLLQLSAEREQVRRIHAPADETLSAGVWHRDGLLAVGRRGVTRIPHRP